MHNILYQIGNYFSNYRVYDKEDVYCIIKEYKEWYFKLYQNDMIKISSKENVNEK